MGGWVGGMGGWLVGWFVRVEWGRDDNVSVIPRGKSHRCLLRKINVPCVGLMIEIWVCVCALRALLCGTETLSDSPPWCLSIM